MDGVPTVLVIDDEADHRHMMRAILDKEFPDCRVVEAADGREGLLRRRGTDDPLLILCDQHMPRLFGHQVFLCLRSRRRLQERWVSISSDVTVGQRAALRAVGVDDVVQKPVLWDDMVQVVRRIVAEWRAQLAMAPAGATPRTDT